MSDQAHYKVLIVDDEPAIREIFCRFLELRGHHVTTCGSASEGIESVNENQYDVIVTDLILPDMTGLDLAEELKIRCPDSKLILLTGKPGEETQRRATELAIFRYLAKPIRAAALIDAVEAAAAS